MAKYTPSTIASGYNSATELNNEFNTIADHLDNKVLYRDNPSGANQMENDLDMNSNDILNAASTSTQELYIAGTKVNVTEFSGTNVIKFYGSVANMKVATDIEVGDLIATKGYYSVGDGGEGFYRVVTPQAFDGYRDHELVDSNIAVLQDLGITNAKQYGAYSDSTNAAITTLAIQAAIDAQPAAGGTVLLPLGSYYIDTALDLAPSITVKGLSKGLAKTTIKQTTIGAHIFSAISASYHSIENLYLGATVAAGKAIYMENCSRYLHDNLVIEGDFTHGIHHKHSGTGGYYNSSERIVVALGSSTAATPIGIWLEGYYSAGQFSRIDVTQCDTGFKIDYANAVTLAMCAIENCTTYGVYVGASTIGLSLQSPYFEGNPNYKNVYCEAGAINIDLNYMRGGSNLNVMFTHDNQIRIDGGLRSFFQANSTDNLLDNGSAVLQATTGVPSWVDVNATLTRETTVTDGVGTALKVTSDASGSPIFASGSQVIKKPTTLENKKMTLSGRYYVPAATTTLATIRIVGSVSGTISSLVCTKDDAWHEFTLGYTTANPTEFITIYASPCWNDTPAGTEYIIVTDMVNVLGEYFAPAPYPDRDDFATYHESSLVSLDEYDYVKPIVFCGYTAISSGVATKTITYPSWFAPTKILSCIATQGSNATIEAIKAEPTTTQVVFTIGTVASGSLKVWFEVKGEE